MTDWTEDSSKTYRKLAQVAVPARPEQIATLLMLIPFGQDETFRAVELASGEGRLAAAILTAFPNATLLALDGEESMRAATAARLQPFGSRAAVAAFDMHQTDWYSHLDGVDYVVSSLCVHHLNGAEKQDLFKAVGARLSPRGALMLADIILPQRVEGWRLFAATLDAAAQAQSMQISGTLELFEVFQSAEWNFYQYAEPDSIDQPSPLFDQLTWLKAAGFDTADCFWMQAGHAIYGGYKGADAASSGQRLSFGEALAIAKSALA